MTINRNVSYRIDHDDTLHELLDILYWDSDLGVDNLNKEWSVDTLEDIGEWVARRKLIVEQ